MDKNKNTIEEVYDWVDSVVFAVTVVMLLFTFVFQIYVVKGSSMNPTLIEGWRVLAWDLFYSPEQGDVVIVDDNIPIGESIIKRVVATENQVVDIDKKTGEITVDGVPFDRPIPANEYNANGDREYPITVPEGFCFVMGDNRGVSYDSRYTAVGFIDSDSIIGKAVLIMSPLKEFGAIR